MPIVVTRETCPACHTPNIEVQHGWTDERNRACHLERCPECGDLFVIVGYDCPSCKAALQGPLAQAEGVADAPLHV